MKNIIKFNYEYLPFVNYSDIPYVNSNTFILSPESSDVPDDLYERNNNTIQSKLFLKRKDVFYPSNWDIAETYLIEYREEESDVENVESYYYVFYYKIVDNFKYFIGELLFGEDGLPIFDKDTQMQLKGEIGIDLTPQEIVV